MTEEIVSSVQEGENRIVTKRFKMTLSDDLYTLADLYQRLNNAKEDRKKITDAGQDAAAISAEVTRIEAEIAAQKGFVAGYGEEIEV